MVSNTCLFSPLFGEDSHYDEHIVQRGWNHQLDKPLRAWIFFCWWFFADSTIWFITMKNQKLPFALHRTNKSKQVSKPLDFREVQNSSWRKLSCLTPKISCYGNRLGIDTPKWSHNLKQRRSIHFPAGPLYLASISSKAYLFLAFQKT